MADPYLTRILAFLKRIGIPVAIGPLKDTLLPGATVRHGVLVYDPDNLPWPGDLLHEAGHIAVTDPAVRASRPEVADDPAEEMAAMAWSYAAAIAIGLNPAIVFHAGGYKSGAASYLASYAGSGGIGVPMLQYYGMTAEARHAARLALPAFPQMARWLR